MSSLHLAAQSGNVHLVRFLIDKYNFTDKLLTSNKRVLPIHLASKKGHVGIVKYFIRELKHSASSEDTNGDDCLSLAIKFKHQKL